MLIRTSSGMPLIDISVILINFFKYSGRKEKVLNNETAVDDARITKEMQKRVENIFLSLFSLNKNQNYKWGKHEQIFGSKTSEV